MDMMRRKAAVRPQRYQEARNFTKLEVGDAARDGKFPFFVEAVGEESPDNARDSAKTKAAWR